MDLAPRAVTVVAFARYAQIDEQRPTIAIRPPPSVGVGVGHLRVRAVG